MSINLVTSFTVGGLLMLSMILLNGQLMENSASTTMNYQAKANVESITRIVSNDILKAGYNVPNSTAVFIYADSTELIFRSDVFNEDVISTITWEWENPDTEYTRGSNPNDYVLRRTVNNGTSIVTSSFAATHFKFTYFDADDNELFTPVTNLGLIRRIEVELISQSTDPAGRTSFGANTYESSFWSRKFIPNSLQFRALN